MSPKDSPKIKINVLPAGIELLIEKGENLFAALRAEGLDIPSTCNGAGTCGQCKVRFESNAPTPTSEDQALLQVDEVEQGWRLSCCHEVTGEGTITLPVQTSNLVAKAEQDRPLEDGAVNSGVIVHLIGLPLPTRDDQRGDIHRLSKSLGKKVNVPLTILQRMPAILRNNDFHASIIEADDYVLDLLPNDQFKGIYGVAIDVGTSTLVGYLFDLACGKQLGVAAASNPQARLGTDVISRIRYVHEKSKQGLEELKNLVLDAVNELIVTMTCEMGIDPTAIYKATVVGNPTMLHLFLGIDPSAIGQSPYVPVLRDRVSFQAAEVGLIISPQANVEVLPSISAYVGADILAGMLAVNIGDRDSVELLLDIGTNGEIVLVTQTKLLACSTAAGPAFEGGSIVQGMSALDGAIHQVYIQGQRLICAVVGDKEPTGICGSGLLDAVAELRRIGLIDTSGRLRKTEHSLSSQIVEEGPKARFLLADGGTPVYLTQKDIREFQVAKAAIRTGIEVLMEQAGIVRTDLKRVYIGGAFGSSMRVESLLRAGLLPPIPKERIITVGNCAGQGAKLALLDREEMAKLEILVARAEYVELSLLACFRDSFMQHIQFPGDD